MAILVSSMGEHETERWSRVANLLQTEYGSVVMHFGEGNNQNVDYKKFLYNERDGALFDYDFKGHLLDMYDNLGDELHHFIDMYSRVGYPGRLRDRYASLPYHEYAHYFYILLDKFSDIILSQGISLVVFDASPMLGVDYALYVAAKCLNVKTLFFFGSQFPSRSFVGTSLETFGKCDGEKRNNAPEIRINKGFTFHWHYMAQRGSHFWKALNIIIRAYGKGCLKACCKGRIKAHILAWLHDMAMGLRNRIYHHDEKRYCHMLSTSDFEKPFIYFPLHLQPEQTTSSLGGKYVDQILAVEKLAKKLPAGWKIYVKENPKQTGFMRGPLFFKRLLGIERVVLVDRKVPTNSLMQYAKMIATIVGTAGYEAVCGGRPVITFGSAWYRDLPGIYSYEDNLNIESIMSSYVYQEDALKLALTRVVENAYPVVSSYYSQKDPGYNEDDNDQALAQLVHEHYMVG